MGNIVNLLVTVGLQRDEEGGEIAFIILPLPEDVAEKIAREQENCSLLAEGCTLSTLLNAYARIIGYESGWFVKAEIIKGGNDDGSD